MFSGPLADLSQAAVRALRDRSDRLVLAESCTGGLIAGALTAVPGASEVFDRGVVTYSNQAKTDLLGVSEALVIRQGAVSAPVAEAMAAGALAATAAATLSVSVTGIAGPDGGTPDKPVGLVYLGLARRNRMVEVHRHVFPGDRDAVRAAAVEAALRLILSVPPTA